MNIEINHDYERCYTAVSRESGETLIYAKTYSHYDDEHIILVLKQVYIRERLGTLTTHEKCEKLSKGGLSRKYGNEYEPLFSKKSMFYTSHGEDNKSRNEWFYSQMKNYNMRWFYNERAAINYALKNKVKN